MKKIICFIMAAMMALSATGCQKPADSDKQVTLTVGTWPDKDSNPAKYEKYEKAKAVFEEENPNIKVEEDTYGFAVDTFLPKAAGGQLPTCFYVPITEKDKISRAGYVADVTEYMEKYGYDENLSDDVKEFLKTDGKYYVVPYTMYEFGIVINKDLFKKAGLVDSEGYVMIPDTYEQLAEYAKIIKEKTGKAGFAMPTMKNAGGWVFTNIAWSFGTEFMKEENGKWTATFNTKEAVDALQWVKDLKWKYDALSENIFIDNGERIQMVANGEAAMTIYEPSGALLTLGTAYKMDRNNIAYAKMPKGPAGRYALVGGSMQAIDANSTPEEIDAAFKWFDKVGMSFNIDQTGIDALDAEWAKKAEDGVAVLSKQPISLYKSGNAYEETNKILEKYCNVDMKNFENYFDNSDVIMKHEEPMNCQELYTLLDSCIQEVLTNKDSDIQSILDVAVNDFQNNYLNNAK